MSENQAGSAWWLRGPAHARDVSEEPPHTEPAARQRLGLEIWIVLGLSLGMSAVYSVVSIIAKLTREGGLSAQTSTLNASRSVRPYLDLTYQLLDIFSTLIPVLLVLWLLAGDTARWRARLGLDRGRRRLDLVHGAGLAALIGLPGLVLYVVGRQLDITTTIVASGLAEYWWTVPVLVLQAVKNAVLEEVVVVGYLMNRLRRLDWPWARVIAASALLRGSYHLYQGFGPFLGNAVMGVVFAEWYRRGGRVWALIVAHTVLDIVSFVGYQYIDLLPDWLGLS